MKQVIAGDIGGTNCRLILAEVDADSVAIRCEAYYPSRAFDDFTTVLEQFVAEACGESLRTNTGIDAACFAVAGPVHHHSAILTNLPWTLDARHLQQRFNIPHVRLINDFVANGYSLAVLGHDDYRLLQSGQPAAGNRVMLGAGTGLGMALIFDCQGRMQVQASEGGHMDFAPCDIEQARLLDFLRQESSCVSYEHVLSGPGLVRLYRYFAWCHKIDAKAVISASDPAAEVSRRALSGEDPLAASALELFFDIYGSCAASLALVGLATGGVYLAGGIAARLVEPLSQSGFVAAFNNKPPMSELLQRMPVKVITNPRAGLLGAAWYAGNIDK